MKKTIFSLTAVCLLSTGVFATDIYINKDSSAGQKLLKSELEYKDYLKNKAKMTEESKKRASQIAKNCEDIQMLKEAVAKLILKTESNSRKIKSSNLKQEEKTNNNENYSVKEIKEIGAKLYTKVENKKDKKICTTKTKRIVDKSRIHESYYKMKDKEFKVVRKKAYIYKYPVLGEKNIGLIKHNEKFIGDMYTAAGWVHVKNKGWVKGYLLSPKVLMDKTKKFDKKNSAYITKTIKDCK